MEQELDLTRIKGIIKRRKCSGTLAFAAVFALFAAVGLLLPDIYQSSATIMVQYPQLPANLVESTVTSYANQRIEGITEQIMSRSRILNLADKFDLLPGERQKLPAEDIVKKIRKRIHVETIDAQIKQADQYKPALMTIAFKLSYEDENPDKARDVATELTSCFMEKNRQDQRKHARNATRFLEAQLGEAKARLDKLEARLAKYRQAHLEELPEFASMNMEKIQTITNDISNLDMQIRQSEEERAVVTTRLAEVDPFGTMSPQVLSTQQRLQQARLEEANLQSRYSALNPLVGAKKREVKLLEREVGNENDTVQIRARLTRLETELCDLKSRYTDKYPAVKRKKLEIERVKKELRAAQSMASQPSIGRFEAAANPAYIELASEAQKADVSIQAMKAQKAAFEKQLKSAYAKLRSMPVVSEEYNELQTDYQNARTNLTDLQQKLAAAKLAQGMEDQQLGETFKVIEPPFLPEKPVKPKRLVIILVGIVLAMGVSVATASFMEYSDSLVYDAETVEKLAGLNVFSTIPKIVTAYEIKQARKKKVLIGIGVLVGIAVAISVFNYFVMELSVLLAKLAGLLNQRIII
ncbi:MAG: hypothetical protein M0Z81_05175 [Deltaproteobacteria bacterium]|jgi:uncharacterized protein involved in exopolysaccharide biosynthesis|nr:hypothetical protein [Deltaproteobacteria bacterium]